VPVGSIACQARGLDAEHRAHLSLAQRLQQPFKSGPVNSGTRAPLVLVNDLYLLPTARACTIRQRVPSRCSNPARPVTQG
jgi:hypothetical protein